MVQQGQEEKRVFAATASTKDLLHEMRFLIGCHTLKIFQDYPILEIRRACLERMNDKNNDLSGSTHIYADWAEDCISQLLEKDDKLWEEVLSWYLYQTPNEHLKQPIDFAVKLALKNCFELAQPVSKPITGRLLNKPWQPPLSEGACSLYEEFPLLRDFFVQVIKNLYERQIFSILDKKPITFNGDFDSKFWVPAERTFRVIFKYQDFNKQLFTAVNQLLLFHQSLTPSDYGEEPWISAGNVCMIKTVAQILKQAQEKAVKKTAV